MLLFAFVVVEVILFLYIQSYSNGSQGTNKVYLL